MTVTKENTQAKTHEAYQVRVIEEHRELSEKLEKLTSFLDGMTEDMNESDLSLLRIQRTTMDSYLTILAIRIDRF